MNRGTPAVAGRASPSHPAEVHAAERLPNLRQVFTYHLCSQPLRSAGRKTDCASFPILARNRQIVNGEVRRLGFTPIPGRRSNSNPGANRRTSCCGVPWFRPWTRPQWSARPDPRRITEASPPCGSWPRISNPGALRGERAAWTGHAPKVTVVGRSEWAESLPLSLAKTSSDDGLATAGIKPGRARIISATRRDTCRGCGGRKEWCDCRESTVCERARGSTDPRRPSVEACRDRKSFSRTGAFVSMAAVGHGGIGDA